MSDQPLLVVADIHGFYGTAHVLEGVNFSMGAEPVALIGRNGMGKSTLCAAIVGLLRSASGSVRLDGEEILGKPAYKIAGAGIGYVPQGRRLFQSLTVDEHLQIVGAKLMTLTPEVAARHYEPHVGKPFYEGLVRFMTSSPVLVLALRGVGAIEISRKLMGATFGSKAAPGTIRGDFGVSNSFNLVHGSDSPESARRELAIFFGRGEIQDYSRASEAWIYDKSSGTPE